MENIFFTLQYFLKQNMAFVKDAIAMQTFIGIAILILVISYLLELVLPHPGAMWTNVIQCLLLALVACIAGMYLDGKLASKYPGFLYPLDKERAMHLIVGLTVGLMVAPIQNDSTYPLRFALGLALYLSYTIRNYHKHSGNLQENIAGMSGDCKERLNGLRPLEYLKGETNRRRYKKFLPSSHKHQLQVHLASGIGMAIMGLVDILSGTTLRSEENAFKWATMAITIGIIGHTQTFGLNVKDEVRKCIRGSS